VPESGALQGCQKSEPRLYFKKLVFLQKNEYLDNFFISFYKKYDYLDNIKSLRLILDISEAILIFFVPFLSKSRSLFCKRI